MSNDEGMTKPESQNEASSHIRHSTIRASFVIRHSCFVIYRMCLFSFAAALSFKFEVLSGIGWRLGYLKLNT